MPGTERQPGFTTEQRERAAAAGTGAGTGSRDREQHRPAGGPHGCPSIPAAQGTGCERTADSAGAGPGPGDEAQGCPGQGGEAGLEAVAPVNEARGRPHVGQGHIAQHCWDKQSLISQSRRFVRL